MSLTESTTLAPPYWVSNMIFTEKSKTVVILPESRLDACGGKRLQQQITALPLEQHTVWILDLSSVEFIDSSGLVALITGLKLAKQNHCFFAITNPSPSVRLILEITQLDRAFSIFNSQDAAHAAAASLFEPRKTVTELAVA